jgi:poly-gamma-glutamate synthesis protein (capsule biosynthesis protein)
VALANNHVGGWGPEGLQDTCAALDSAGVPHAGAGDGPEAAARPAVLETPEGRLRLFSYAFLSRGTPPEWRAAAGRAGVNPLDAANGAALRRILGDLRAGGRGGGRQCGLAALGTELEPGGSARPSALRPRAGPCRGACGAWPFRPSPDGIEAAAGRAILYGCGDFLNECQGIPGREAFRPDLVLGYVSELGPDGRLAGLEALPFRIRGVRLERAAPEAAAWLRARPDRDGAALGTRAHPGDGGGIRPTW